MAFDPNAYSMYSAAVQQTQAKIAAYQQAKATNPAGAAMYDAAIAQEQANLQQYQQQQSAQQAAYPMQVNEAGYQAQRDDTNQKFGSQLAAQDYAQTLAQQRYSREQGDFQMNQAQQRPHVDSSYLRRGVFNSGIRQQGLSDWYQGQAQQQGTMLQNQQAGLGAIAQQRAQLQQQQQSELAGVDMRRQQDIYNQLAALRAAGG